MLMVGREISGNGRCSWVSALHYPSGAIPRPVLCPSYPWGCGGWGGWAGAKDAPLRWWEWAGQGERLAAVLVGRAGRGERFPSSGRSWRVSAETYFHVIFLCLPENCESDFFCDFFMNSK